MNGTKAIIIRFFRYRKSILWGKLKSAKSLINKGENTLYVMIFPISEFCHIKTIIQSFWYDNCNKFSLGLTDFFFMGLTYYRYGVILKQTQIAPMF